MGITRDGLVEFDVGNRAVAESGIMPQHCARFLYFFVADFRLG